MSKLKNFFARLNDNVHLQGLKAFFVRYSDLSIGDAAAAMTYYIFLAIFPFLVFLVSFLAFISQRFALNGDLHIFETLVPEAVALYIRPLLRQIVVNSQFSTFSISAISILWAAASGFDTFLFTLEKIYRLRPQAFWLKRLLGIFFIIIMSLAVTFSLLSASFGTILLQQLYQWTKLPLFNSAFLYYLRFLMPFCFVCLILSVIYYLGSKRKGRFLQALTAALVPTLVWLFLSLGLSFYVDNFTRYNVVYGALAGIIMMMFWLYLLMQFVFIGALIHHSVLKN